MAAPAQSTQQGYSGALFPTQMFPSLTQIGTSAQQEMAPATGKQEGRDELVEYGAILALLKLAFG
jgi:hypothetical protein